METERSAALRTIGLSSTWKSPRRAKGMRGPMETVNLLTLAYAPATKTACGYDRREVNDRGSRRRALGHARP